MTLEATATIERGYLRQSLFGLNTETSVVVKNLRAFLQSAWLDTSSSANRLQRILRQIVALQGNKNVDDYIFKPSLRATKTAKAYMWAIYGVDNDFPEPEIDPDGLGGIIIQWNHNGRTVTLGCRPDRTLKDFIYHENGRYGIMDASSDKLKERLTWLIS